MTNDEDKTPAGRLERALRDHAADRKAAAELAAEVAPEFERLKTLGLELAALSQDERRKVLDAAGMKEVSAAPKPLPPVRGASFRQPPMLQPARWQVWRLMPGASLWQAVCLSLDIEPESRLTDEATRTRSDYSRLPADYWDRLTVCKASVSTNGPIQPHGPLYRGMLNNPDCAVLLSEVAAFAIGCGWPIPDAMRALVSAPASKPDEDESKEERQDRRLKACDDAGLAMPGSPVGRLPDGIARIAKAEGVSRQAFSDDIKAALARRAARLKEGKGR